MTAETLVNENIRLAYAIAHKAFVAYRGPLQGTRDAQDELRSAALYGLAVAATKFDPARGLKPSTFFWPVIRNECYTAMREMANSGIVSRGKNRPAVNQFNDFAEEQFTTDTVESERAEDLMDDVMSAIGTLEERDQQMIEARFIHGKSLREIAQEHGLSYERVRQRINRGRDAVREMVKTGIS